MQQCCLLKLVKGPGICPAWGGGGDVASQALHAISWLSPPPTTYIFPDCPPSPPLRLLQYLGVGLLLHALQRSRTPVLLQLPSRQEMRALLDTFGLLTVFYVFKNLSYLTLQVGSRD